MKKLLMICLFVSVNTGLAQSFVLGDSAQLRIGSQSRIFTGGDATFNGTVKNEGTIISFSDMDFVDNINVGSLSFVGIEDQVLSGDSLNVVDLEINMQEEGVTVELATNQVVVTGGLQVTSGIVQATDEEDLLVSGSTDGQGEGYVDGKLVGFTAGRPVTFPMGVNGFANYITLSNTTDGVIMRVECQAPPADPEFLRADGDVVEISDEVEWMVTSTNGATTEANVTIDFSGVDLSANVYGENIRANIYDPVVLALAPGDTIFRVLESIESPSYTSNQPSSLISGRIVTSSTISIGAEPTILALGLIPVADDIYFFVPNAFTPNGTFSDNQRFRPFFTGDEITSVSIAVYNSFNDLVYSFSLTEPNIDMSEIGWDGVLSNGISAPGGVYYYDISLTSTNSTQQKTGAVLLLE